MADKIENTKSIRNLKTTEELSQYLDQLRRNRQDRELEWRLNLSFYRGDQWVWKGLDGRIWGYPVADGEKPRNKIRITSNQILPCVNAYVAQLMKTKPVIMATPDSISEKDIVAAQVADDLYQAQWRNLDIADKFAESLTWATIAEAGWLKVSYDPWAGDPVNFMVDPEGQIIQNPDLRELYSFMLAEQGMEPQTLSLKTGDLRVDALSPFQVYVDPTARVFSDAQYAFCIHPMSPDEVYTRFGVWIEPDSIKDSNEALRPWRASNSGSADIVNVNLGYFRPGPILEKGRYVVWVDNQEKHFIDKEWDLPTTRLPLIPIPGIRVPGTAEWEALVSHARPIQKEINKTLSQLVMMKDLTVTPRYWAPAGSFEGTRITNEGGIVRYYNPVSGMKPEPEVAPPVPEYVIMHLQDLQGRMDRLFNLQAITRGDVPANVEAGIAIDLLQEAAVDQVAPQIQAIEEALVDLGELLVSYAHKYYQEPRMLKMIGEGGVTRVRTFQATDVQGGYSFHCEAGSGLPRTRAGRAARIEQLMSAGVVSPHQAWKHFELADLKGVQQIFAADEDLILREHDALLKGNAPLNDVEYSRAMQAAQAGINIYTQQPMQGGDQEMQQILMDASLTPLPFENSAMHYDSHALKMKSPEYAQYPLEIKMRFQRHIELTKMKLMSEQPDDPKLTPRTSLTLHGTVGPTVAAKILQKNAVDANPQELLEPPLETLVMDSVDQVDKDEAANDPLTEYERQMQLLEAQLKVAEMQNKLELAKQRARDASQPDTQKELAAKQQELSMLQTLQNIEYDAEKHEIEIEKAAQEAAHKQRLHAQEVANKQRESEEKVKASRASRRNARRKESSGSSR